MTLQETFDWTQDPTQICANCPVITNANFTDLATQAVEFTEVTKTIEEIEEIFVEQSKRFSACGGNNSERFGVLRKNPKTGWQYLIDLITER